MKLILEWAFKVFSTIIMSVALYIFNNFQASFDGMKSDITTMKDSIVELNTKFAVYNEKQINSQRERNRLEKRIERLEVKND